MSWSIPRPTTRVARTTAFTSALVQSRCASRTSPATAPHALRAWTMLPACIEKSPPPRDTLQPPPVGTDADRRMSCASKPYAACITVTPAPTLVASRRVDAVTCLSSMPSTNDSMCFAQ